MQGVVSAPQSRPSERSLRNRKRETLQRSGSEMSSASPSSGRRASLMIPAPVSASPIAASARDEPMNGLPDEPQLSQPTPPTSPPAVQVVKQTHRHSQANAKALDQLKKYYAQESGWTLYSDAKGMRISTSQKEGGGMPLMKGETEIRGGWNVEDVIAVIQSLGARKVWDERFDSGKIADRFDNRDELLTHNSQKGVWPVTARDFALSSHVVREGEVGEDSSKVYVLSTSVEDDKIPVEPKKVRADMHVAGWVLEPEYMKGTGMTALIKATYIVEVDIKLESIPSAILKIISTSTPACAGRVDDFLQTRGCPPYWKDLSLAGLSYTEEQFDAKTGEASFKVGLNTKTPPKGLGDYSVSPFRWSKRMYPNGFDMTITPKPPADAVIVEAVGGKAAENLRITFDRRLLGDEQYSFQIQKRGENARGTEVIVNGKPISIASSTDVMQSPSSVKRVPVLPTPEAYSTTPADNAVATPPQTPLSSKVRNGTAATADLSQQSPKSTAGAAAAAGITSAERSKQRKASRSASNVKREMIPEETKATSRNIGSSTPSSSPMLSDTAATPAVTKSTTDKAATAVSSVDQAVRGSEKTVNQSTTHPAAAGVPSNAVLILGPELHFNARQLAALIAAFFIAYYMGKFSVRC